MLQTPKKYHLTLKLKGFKQSKSEKMFIKNKLKINFFVKLLYFKSLKKQKTKKV